MIQHHQTERSGLVSRSQAAALRGLAIMGIMLHNYCHFLNFAIKENEYTFTEARPQQFLDKLFSLDIDLFIHFFSFFGHYGVPVFLFLSGFGLVMKYEKGASAEAHVAPFRFMGYHFLKLFRLMIIPYLVFIAVYILVHPNTSFYTWDRVVTQLSMTCNFMYFKPDLEIKPGPYWFFGLMMQLYLLYLLVIHRWRRAGVLLGLVALAFAIQMACGDDRLWLNFVRYNVVGGVLPFCMGVAYARFGKDMPVYADWAILLVSAVFLLFGSLYQQVWYWLPLFVVTGAVSTVRLLPSALLNPCAWVGSVSAAMFVVHPIIRELVLMHYRRYNIYSGIAVYVLASFSAAMLLMYFLQYIPKPKSTKT